MINEPEVDRPGVIEERVFSEHVCCRHHHHHHRSICWKAIFAGAFVGMGLTFLLNLFGLAIGLTAFTLNQSGAVALVAGGFIGMLIGIIISMGLAGFTAGYLGRRPGCHPHHLGLAYGFTTWSVVLVLTALMATHITHYATTYANMVSHSTFIMNDTQSTASVTVNTDTTPATSKKMTTQKENTKTITATTNTETMAWGAFIIFILFFIGAISSCVGACLGMGCKRDEICDRNDVDVRKF